MKITPQIIYLLCFTLACCNTAYASHERSVTNTWRDNIATFQHARHISTSLKAVSHEWNKLSPYNDNTNRQFLGGDIFNFAEASTKLKRSIQKDYLAKRNNGKEFTYIISGGQKHDILWLLNTISQLLIKDKNHDEWTVNIVVINGAGAALNTANNIIDNYKVGKFRDRYSYLRSDDITRQNKQFFKPNLTINGTYLLLDMQHKDDIAQLKTLLEKHKILRNFDGVMHNLGGSTNAVNTSDYPLFLWETLQDGGWMQIENWTPNKRIFSVTEKYTRSPSPPIPEITRPFIQSA